MIGCSPSSIVILKNPTTQQRKERHSLFADSAEEPPLLAPRGAAARPLPPGAARTPYTPASRVLRNYVD